ncbi:BrnT family toxin [Nostoc edaphicum CCNP1411]|uniref:BrnT family toxin n=1 Tax=Nostoc edaphicum CCNP1411 TaxID=1472755 RepID=A0A7D7LH57_9NOSO|nr:BrnT family toxin [Nostoc edaphicum CCNP1411]
MSEIKFEWNLSKAKSNERKHGVSFEEAKTVFYDENARLIYDPEHSVEEDRFLLLGMSDEFRLLVVSHLYKDSDRLIRIISVRTATRHERKQYEEFLP